MAYLLCRNCSGYFKLEANESPQDYESCSCGGQLRYLKSIRSFCEDLKADLVEVDNSVILHDHLKSFKDRIQIEKVDSSNFDTSYSDYEDHYQDNSEDGAYFEYETNTETENYSEVLEDLNYYNGDNQLGLASLNEFVKEPKEEPEYTIDYSIKEIFPDNQIALTETSYATNVHSDYVDYFDNYVYNDSIFLSGKTYLKNHALTLMGFIILPLEYYYLYGSLPVLVMASFVIAVPLILFYLPRSSEINSHGDVQKVCAIWVIYYIIFGIMLLSWLLFTQRPFEALYLI